MSETIPPATAELSSAVLDALRKSELFSTLSDEALLDVAARSVMRKVRRGDRLYSRGAPSESLAVVADGRVKCWAAGGASRQWVSAVVRAGGECGLAACVDDGPHTCHADPMERSRVVIVPGVAVRDAMDRDVAFARRVAVALVRQLRRALATSEDVTLRSPIERLARYIAAQAAPDDVVELRDTQTQIAAQLGTVREVVGRAFRRLQALGVVSRTGHTVRILERRELARIGKKPD